MNKQLFQLVLIQFREFYREPGVLFWSIGFPILMAWGLGVAFTQKAEMVRKIAVVEAQHSPKDSVSNLEKFLTNSATKRSTTEKNISAIYEKKVSNDKFGDAKFIFMLTSMDNAIVLIKRGTVSIILDDQNGNLTYHLDPLNPEGRLLHLQLSSLINNQQSLESSENIKPLSLEGTRYIDFLIPGLLAMGVMMSGMWGISYTLIDKRAKKLLRRMVATPMKKSNFIISHFIGRMILGTIESFLLFVFAYFYFGITIQGSLIALLTIFIAGNIAFSGIAVFCASRTSSPEIGNGLINAVVTPMMVLSGVFFSYHNFPDWSIMIIKNMPLTMLADGMRAVFIEGAGFKDIIASTGILSGIGIVFFLAGLKIYKWY